MEVLERLDTAAARAVDEAEFDACMLQLGGFEASPKIAVGVSGGPDSTALALLLDAWTRRRGGHLHAFTVDHGLRPESAAEALAVSKTLSARGISHRVLSWRPDAQSGNLQARARAARYELLSAACRREGILHLALAHHRDDQAETLMLRLGRGSGLEGLAAMAPVSYASDLRVIRPLLSFPKERLRATCRKIGAEWIEDPSNDNSAFARVRMRQALARLEPEGFSAKRLAETAEHLGVARQAIEHAVAERLVRCGSLHPAGFLWLNPEGLRRAPTEVAQRALARILMTVGGADYPPRFERLERLYESLRGGLRRARTLGGCRILPRRGRWLVVREAAMAKTTPADAGGKILWDGRFVCAFGRNVPAGAELRALGEDGWPRAAGLRPELAELPLPAPARAGLPALFLGNDLLDVAIPGYETTPKGRESLLSCRLRPKVPLVPQGFTVALRSGHIIC
ncbi:MAG: tRNA lysidine(34) synthetase TilS [Rhodovibrionaceae bacterium]|nr:tRNA lysidine(34) synthetase TilS [Rhodovibrionaceae bacterium]